MPLDCPNSFASGDQECGKVLVCLRDTGGSAYFGLHGTGPFENGSSPDGYVQDYPNANQYEQNFPNVQCFLLNYTPSPNGGATDSITIQETDANNNNVGPPCILTFNVPQECGGGGAPECPDPQPAYTYDIGNPNGNFVVDIVSDLGFSADCTLTFSNEGSATIAVAAGQTTITMTQAGITSAGIGTYTILYGVDCDDGFNNCEFTLNVVNNTAALTCPQPTPSFTYDKNTATGNFGIIPSDLGFADACDFTSSNSTTLTTSIQNNNKTVFIDQTNLDAQPENSSHVINYTITCNGESVACDFNLTVTDSSTGNVCIDCNAVQVDFNGAPIAQGTTQTVACGSAPVEFSVNIPNPNSVNLGYYFAGSSAGSFSFVSSDQIINGFQRQTWVFTPKSNGCSETINVGMNWLDGEAQSGCPICPLFNIVVDNCADCGGGGGCTSIANCISNNITVSANNTFTLMASGCDCPGCQVTWSNDDSNPQVIPLTNVVGSSVTNTWPANAIQGNYRFNASCCGCN